MYKAPAGMDSRLSIYYCDGQAVLLRQSCHITGSDDARRTTFELKLLMMMKKEKNKRNPSQALMAGSWGRWERNGGTRSFNARVSKHF